MQTQTVVTQQRTVAAERDVRHAIATRVRGVAAIIVTVERAVHPAIATGVRSVAATLSPLRDTRACVRAHAPSNEICGDEKQEDLHCPGNSWESQLLASRLLASSSTGRPWILQEMRDTKIQSRCSCRKCLTVPVSQHSSCLWVCELIQNDELVVMTIFRQSVEAESLWTSTTLCRQRRLCSWSMVMPMTRHPQVPPSM